jgi:hypothetical protein
MVGPKTLCEDAFTKSKASETEIKPAEQQNSNAPRGGGAVFEGKGGLLTKHIRA